MENKKKMGDPLDNAYDDYGGHIEDTIYDDHGEYDIYNELAESYTDSILKNYGENEAQPEKEEHTAVTSASDNKRVENIQPRSDKKTAPPRRERTFMERPYEPPVGDYTTRLDVPKAVLEVIDLLKAHTYTAYLVGECVNMLVLGERVMDFDIACNASIDRIIAIFEDKFKVRQDLVERGELIIINGGMGISVAPYRSRIDGSGKPIYCKTVDEDLRRRTFTSETVAYNPDSGIYDQFGGLSCITAEKTILRAIDEEKYEKMELEQETARKKPKEQPKKIVIEAIRENPECILTAMQKYAMGEAEISPFTLRNINENAELIDMMLPSEISRYFRRILTGRRIGEALTVFRDVLLRLFPVLRPQIGFDQKSAYQEYDLFEHTVRAVGYGAPDYTVRLALLLHGIGKPDCAADRGEYNTYYGHSERGVMLARDAFEEYEADEAVIDRVLFLIAHHDDHISPENITEFVAAFGTENTRLLLLLQSANVRAKSTDPVNERVSSTLRQLADNVSFYAPSPRGIRGRIIR